MQSVISLYFRHVCKFIVVITAQKFDLWPTFGGSLQPLKAQCLNFNGPNVIK